jgi:predicted Na+-dependent transporter
MRALTIATNLFPIWVLLAGILALFFPPLFTWFSGPFIVWGLAIIMLGMGVTLSIDDFKSVAKMPKAVAAGFIAQYTIMPLLGWSVATALQLPDQFAAGLILVACCPGGTASNVVTYLAKANVALSVLMTMCSTFAAVLMTPLLTKWLAGKIVPVDAVGLFLRTLQVVLLPLLIGLALHHLQRCLDTIASLHERFPSRWECKIRDSERSWQSSISQSRQRRHAPFPACSIRSSAAFSPLSGGCGPKSVAVKYLVPPP